MSALSTPGPLSYLERSSGLNVGSYGRKEDLVRLEEVLKSQVLLAVVIPVGECRLQGQHFSKLIFSLTRPSWLRVRL